jgi:hypothetical protein
VGGGDININRNWGWRKKFEADDLTFRFDREGGKQMVSRPGVTQFFAKILEFHIKADETMTKHY